MALDVSEAALRSSVAAAARRVRAGRRCTAWSATSPSTWRCCRASRRGWWRSSGGTIGNLLPAERAKFLAALRDNLEAGEWLLLGTDLVKDRDTLVRAYDDAAGVTAEFNRNVLHVLNRELAADFDVAAFEHVALWNARGGVDRDAPAGHAGDGACACRWSAWTITFAEGEEMRTEVSSKFRRERVAAELADAGFALTDGGPTRPPASASPCRGPPSRPIGPANQPPGRCHLAHRPIR